MARSDSDDRHGVQSVQLATADYEAWLSRWFSTVAEDLKRKHVKMRAGPFEFLRASFYRWSQRWPIACPDLADAPQILGVGDVHVENFGTWRDAEGRLVWGVNDVDEAYAIPYTNDLVRLATSARLADSIKVNTDDACAAILNGYSDRIGQEPQPFLLAEHDGLRELAADRLKNPKRFWAKKFEADDGGPELIEVAEISPLADRILAAAMPEGGLPYVRYRRRAGLGSLGRPRFAALASWRGGQVARDVKALAPSGWLWANHTPEQAAIAPLRCLELLDCAGRSPDPTVAVHDRWIVRRLAPDSSRIELGDLPKQKEASLRKQQAALLSWMGQELANLHLASQYQLSALRADLDARPPNWLRNAAAVMKKITIEDFEDYSRR
jgi:hypothetical protein